MQHCCSCANIDGTYANKLQIISKFRLKKNLRQKLQYIGGTKVWTTYNMGDDATQRKNEKKPRKENVCCTSFLRLFSLEFLNGKQIKLDPPPPLHLRFRGGAAPDLMVMKVGGEMRSMTRP